MLHEAWFGAVYYDAKRPWDGWNATTAVEVLGTRAYDPKVGRGGDWRSAAVASVEGENVTITFEAVRHATVPESLNVRPADRSARSTTDALESFVFSLKKSRSSPERRECSF